MPVCSAAFCVSVLTVFSWCHVMEHESFSNPETAKILNDAFVNIKVDREERPDIDRVYMVCCTRL